MVIMVMMVLKIMTMMIQGTLPVIWCSEPHWGRHSIFGHEGWVGGACCHCFDGCHHHCHHHPGHHKPYRWYHHHLQMSDHHPTINCWRLLGRCFNNVCPLETNSWPVISNLSFFVNAVIIIVTNEGQPWSRRKLKRLSTIDTINIISTTFICPITIINITSNTITINTINIITMVFARLAILRNGGTLAVMQNKSKSRLARLKLF